MSDRVTVQSNSPGVGFAGLLFLVFLVLKLTHVISWSWWWVTAPLWIGAGIGVAVLAVVLVIFLTVGRKYRN